MNLLQGPELKAYLPPCGALGGRWIIPNAGPSRMQTTGETFVDLEITESQSVVPPQSLPSSFSLLIAME